MWVMSKEELKLYNKLNLAIWFIKWQKDSALSNCNHKEDYEQTEQMYDNILCILSNK